MNREHKGVRFVCKEYVIGDSSVMYCGIIYLKNAKAVVKLSEYSFPSYLNVTAVNDNRIEMYYFIANRNYPRTFEERRVIEDCERCIDILLLSA